MRHARSAKAAWAVLAVLLLPPTLVAAETDSLRVDLNDFPLFVRSGWDESQAGEIPRTGDALWTVLPPAGKAGRIARPIELELPGLPKRKPFSLANFPDLDFSYMIPFELAPAAAERYTSEAVPGLHFAGLGDNWEIFVNGKPVRSEMHRDASGRIREHRANRDIHFPFDGSLLRPGANLVAVHIVADPTYPPAGFHQAAPYFIDEYPSIVRSNAEILPVTFCGLYLFIGLYHLFIFAVRPQDRHNLYYGLFSMDLAIYLFSRTHSVNFLILDSHLLFRIELAALFVLLPFVGAFLESLNDNRVSRVTLIYGAFCWVLTLVELFAPVAFVHDLLRFWQLTGLGMALYIFGWDILWRFISEGRRRWKRQRDLERADSLGRTYLVALFRTPIGNILIGGFILFVTAVFDIIDAVVFQWDLVLTQYGFFLFTMGTALILANRLGFLHVQLSGLNQNLEERIRVLTETGAKLSASERRYRSLFEGTSDPVALLDEGLRFIEANAASIELFGLDRPGRKGSTLLDAIYAEEREGSLPLDLLREAVATQRDKGEPREVALRVRTALGEPKPCRLRLERIDSLERKELLLRVSPEKRDALVDAFVEGRERYLIPSSLSAADEVCRLATARLARYIPEEDAGFLAVCLREVVVNAVEHGNLELSFEDKSRSQREGRYFEILQRRRLDPRYRDRRVVVEYSVSAARATYRVTDEGPGFDHSAYSAPGDLDPGLLEHGRGLFMARSAFDLVAFNPKGNQVTLAKYFRAEGA